MSRSTATDICGPRDVEVPVYCNDNDPFACAWARNLIKAGLVPPGDVDERPIGDVRPEDLRGHLQCHFFSGILGWPYALRLAGWPDDSPVWTGSCPCQPFSTAGKRKGEEDERHLWPAWLALIRECRPDCLFGEQVSSRDGYRWLDGVRTDLEAEGYAFGAADLPASSAGAPHIRQRLWWVATLPHAESRTGAVPVRTRKPQQQVSGVAGDSSTGHSPDTGRASLRHQRQPLAGAARGDQGEGDQRQRVRGDAGDGVATGLPRDTEHNGRAAADLGGSAGEGEKKRRVCQPEKSDSGGFWDAFDIIHYRDGKARRCPRSPQSLVESLADGLPADLAEVWFDLCRGFPLSAKKINGRANILRGAGNAICPQTAAMFVRAFLDVTP